MAFKLIVLAAAALLQVAVSIPVAPETSGVVSIPVGVLDRSQPQVGIFGGKNITIDKANYIGSVNNYYNDALIGTAVILNNHWILTAAYLVAGFPLKAFNVRVGSRYSTKQGNVIAPKAVFIPSKYTGTNWDYDVALVKLSTPLKFSGTIGSVRLSSSKLPKNGAVGQVYGFGYTTETSFGNYLQKASLPISNYGKCRSHMPAFFSSLSFCTIKDGVGPCQNDYGSPLVYKNNVVGTFSGAYGCGEASRPAAFADISKYNKWIETTIKHNTEAGEILEYSDEIDQVEEE